MIYFDNAATTYPKPPQVIRAVDEAMRKYGANPGRAGHTMSMETAEELYRCRTAVAEFFHAPGPECVVFTLNCTQAINFVLKGVLKSGDHVVTSNLEHNAFRKALRANTKLIVCTHVSNVWGIRLPIERLAALGHEYGVPIAVDCAQSAGVLPVDMQEFQFDYLCVAAHKGLYAPMGTGILITPHGASMETLMEGGTGTASISLEQPETMPDRLESGTINIPGIAGIRAGISFVKSKGIERIYRHELGLIQALYRSLSKMEGVQLYTPEPVEPYFAPVLSFNIKEANSEAVAQRLNAAGIAVRAGLHCAPRAHESFGTLQQGAVRVCPSAFNNMNEIRAFSNTVMKIHRK